MKKESNSIDVPLLSVCLITYNHGKYIRQALDSVLAQNVDFLWQIVVADDFSTDETRDILEAYKEKYPDLIELIFQQKNVGACQNWIDLLTFPKSKYIAYLEGDDYWTDPQKLQKQVSFLQQNHDYSLHFHNVMKHIEPTNEVRYFNNESIASFNPTVDDLLSLRVGVPSCSWLFKREALVIPSWIFECAMGDWPTLFFFEAAGKLRYSSEVMGVYRKHGGGASTKIVHGKLELIKILKLFQRDVPRKSAGLNKHISKLYMETAMLEKNAGKSFKYLNHLIRAVTHNPRTLFRAWKTVIFILLPLQLAKSLQKNNSLS